MQLALGDKFLPEEESGLFGLQVPFIIGKMIPGTGRGLSTHPQNIIGYAPAMNLSLIEDVSRLTLGFPIQPQDERECLHPAKVFRKILGQTTSESRDKLACVLYERHNPFTLTAQRVTTIGIKRNVNLQDRVNDADIVDMVTRFLRALRRYSFTARLIKGLVLHDLKTLVKEAHSCILTGNHYPRAGSRCVLENLNQRLQRVEDEVFLFR